MASLLIHINFFVFLGIFIIALTRNFNFNTILVGLTYLAPLVPFGFHSENMERFLLVSYFNLIFGLIEIIVLSFVQGVSEFLPISSSAHLLIISKLKTFQSSSLEIDISLHLGSLLAIIFYFRKDLSGILKNKGLSLLIILGSIPLIVVGFILHKTGLINYLRNMITFMFSYI
jgi:hypothetical protein